MSRPVSIVGSGRGQTVLRPHDAYAFTTTDGPIDRVTIRDMDIGLHPDSVCGGAVRSAGAPGTTAYHSQWMLKDINAAGADGSPDPLYHLDGWIGSDVVRCQAGSADIGFLIASDGFVSNASNLTGVRAVLCRTAGLKTSGGSLLRIRDAIIESNPGVGLWLHGTNTPILDATWFENNAGHIYCYASHARIRDSKFHYMPEGTDVSPVRFDGPPRPQSAYGPKIADCMFQNRSPTGYDIEVSANVAGARIEGNRLVTRPDFLLDNGVGTVVWDNYDNDHLPVTNVMPGSFAQGETPYYGQPVPSLREGEW